MRHVLARPPIGGQDTVEEGAHSSAPQRVGVLSRFLNEARHALATLEPRRALWATTRLLPDFQMPGTRAQALRLLGCDVRRSVSIFGDLRLVGPRGSARNLRIGPGSCIGPDVTFCLDACITLGTNVSIGPYAMLYTATHALGHAARRMHPTPSAQEIFIEDGAWIGLAAVILPGVRIGRGSVVSAGAVVTKDVPAHRIVAGNPAAVTSQLPED